MKKYSTLMVLCFLILCGSVSAQASKQKASSPVSSVEISPEKATQIQSKINQIDRHIQAIETKKAYILSDPQELVIANETGWFDSMENVKAGLLFKKSELLNVLNGVDDE